MATFVAMFYSQRSRRLLLNASKHWNTKKDLFTLLKQVLDDKYLKTASRESDDYKMFSDNTFTMILDLLYKENKYAFPYNPKTISGGFNSEYYIGKLYKLLNVDYKIFDYNVSDDHLFYSYLNEEFNSMEYRIVRKNIKTLVYGNRRFTYVDKDMVAPQVLMVIAHDNKKFTNFYKDLFPNTVINGSDTKKNLTSLSEKIYYHGVEYNLDSVILSNWNKRKTGHAIAGITCKKNKYVYNGWTRSSMDPMMARTVITRNIPCELMKYEWNIKKHNDFCLNTRTCFPDILKTKKDAKKVDLCFNFSKGRRILVYIRKEAAVNTSNENEKDTKIIPRSKSPIKPKIIPRSKSPIKPKIIPRSKSPIKPKTAKAKAVVKKSCPEGKVRNPETGRCILIKNAKVAKAKAVVKKSCPEGKVRNPETGRCILIKNAKVAKAKAVVKKSCPEGKVRNPETGRCILIKNAKVAKAKAVVKKYPIKKPNDNNAVELSVFTYISKDLNFRRTAYYNEMIFVKLGNKVYIEISEGDEQNAPVNEMLDILMPFEELMKNKYLKKYYELSRMAIGKPNIDTNYYRENVNIKNNYHLIDTLYIVEDPLTKIKFAKKGNSYRHFNLAKLKKMTVADAYSIEEFNNEYNIRYGVDDKTLDEVVANYTALANQL
jgi:nucleoid DNA-binding protein